MREHREAERAIADGVNYYGVRMERKTKHMGYENMDCQKEDKKARWISGSLRPKYPIYLNEHFRRHFGIPKARALF